MLSGPPMNTQHPRHLLEDLSNAESPRPMLGPLVAPTLKQRLPLLCVSWMNLWRSRQDQSLWGPSDEACCPSRSQSHRVGHFSPCYVMSSSMSTLLVKFSMMPKQGTQRCKSSSTQSLPCPRSHTIISMCTWSQWLYPFTGSKTSQPTCNQVHRNVGGRASRVQFQLHPSLHHQEPASCLLHGC